MKRATFDIDRKVLAGLIVGAATYAVTKLAIPVDPELEQLINVSAAVAAAYFVPSSTPTALLNEVGEADDVPFPPTADESSTLRDELPATVDPAAAGVPFDPDSEDEGNDVPELPSTAEVSIYRMAEDHSSNGGGTATLVAPLTSTEVDEAAVYGAVNSFTGSTADEVADEFETDALDDEDDDDGGGALVPRARR
jgi:hypothetical protein